MSWRMGAGRKEDIEDQGGDVHDIAFEKHYSIAEIVELWGLSEKTIRRIFAGEPDVLEWGHEEQRFKRAYRTLRIPESVLQRVHRRMRKAS
jgi:predicted transcriptional regulator